MSDDQQALVSLIQLKRWKIPHTALIGSGLPPLRDLKSPGSSGKIYLIGTTEILSVAEVGNYRRPCFDLIFLWFNPKLV